ncbi:MAG TPA: DinB family protein, partial [Polyangiales bacterium]
MEHSQFHLSRTALPADAMVSLLRYKRWADTELMASALTLSWFGRMLVGKYVAAIVRHFHTVDCIFRAHLLGESHGYTSSNPAEPTTLAELQERVRTIDDWYVDYAQDLDALRLTEPLNVTFTDGARQTLTRSDMLLHVVQHGAYHRGNIGILLRVVGA